MTAIARVGHDQQGPVTYISIQFYLVIDPVLGITPNDVAARVRLTFGTAFMPAIQVAIAHFPWPASFRRGYIKLRTNITSWYGQRESVFRDETFLTDDSHYRRQGTVCREERFRGFSTDVITFYADRSLQNPLSKLEHELGHALGIRHTLSRYSPMYNGAGTSQGTSLTYSDVIDILWQIDPNNQDRPQTLSSRAIRGIRRPYVLATPESPIAQ